MKKLLPIIVVLGLIGAGVYLFLGRGGKGIGGSLSQKASEVFTGSLKMAIEKGIPMKCTYKVEGNKYEGIVKGKSWRGKMKSADGKVGEVIIKDECMWSWSENEGVTQGVKMCFQGTTEEGQEPQSVWDQDSFSASGIEYRCVPTVVTGSEFEPPANVQFMDLSQFGQQ